MTTSGDRSPTAANDVPQGDLIREDGRAKCPSEDCDWWVPEGMEYLFATHEIIEHEEPQRTIELCQAENGQWYAADGDDRSPLVDEPVDALRQLAVGELLEDQLHDRAEAVLEGEMIPFDEHTDRRD